MSGLDATTATPRSGAVPRHHRPMPAQRISFPSGSRADRSARVLARPGAPAVSGRRRRRRVPDEQPSASRRSRPRGPDLRLHAVFPRARGQAHQPDRRAPWQRLRASLRRDRHPRPRGVDASGRVRDQQPRRGEPRPIVPRMARPLPVRERDARGPHLRAVRRARLPSCPRRSGRLRRRRRRDDYIETARLELAPLEPDLADGVAATIEERAIELLQHQPAVLGTQRVLASSPFDRPKMSDRSAMPLCFASTRDRRAAFTRGWHDFVAAFRQASSEFRRGFLEVVFPPFSFRPSTAAG
jgi:hypothetical protein